MKINVMTDHSISGSVFPYIYFNHAPKEEKCEQMLDFEKENLEGFVGTSLLQWNISSQFLNTPLRSERRELLLTGNTTEGGRCTESLVMKDERCCTR